MWLYAANDVDTKVVLHVQLSEHRGRDPAEAFLKALREKHRVNDAEFLVDGMGYLNALAQTNLNGGLNYTNHNIVEKLLQTYTMRIGRFHETCNGSQPVLCTGLTAYTAYYNHHRSQQAEITNHRWRHSNRRAQSSSAAVTDISVTSEDKGKDRVRAQPTRTNINQCRDF